VKEFYRPVFGKVRGKNIAVLFSRTRCSNKIQPGIERVAYRTLADISRSALCWHSNKTRAPIANPPNSAQLEGTPYHFPKLHPGPCSSVGMRRGSGTHRQTDTQTRVVNIHFASATPHVKCNKGKSDIILEMWANAQRNGRPVEYRWRPLFNAAKFG